MEAADLLSGPSMMIETTRQSRRSKFTRIRLMIVLCDLAIWSSSSLVNGDIVFIIECVGSYQDLRQRPMTVRTAPLIKVPAMSPASPPSKTP